MHKICMIILASALALTNAYAQSMMPDAAAIKAQVDKVVVPYMKNNNVPGAAIAVYMDGKEYYFNYGAANVSTKAPVTSDSLFEIASNTKVFTATLLAYEIKNGKIKLDDPIIKFLPPLANTTNLPIDTVTVQNLATHTASFPRDTQDFGVPKGNMTGLLKALKTWQPNFPIGSEHLYSNIGFGLLGTVVSNASGIPYQQLLQQVILQPLNMQNTFIKVPATKDNIRAQGYRKNNKPAPYFVPTPILGGGELVSSSHDLMQFIKANLNVMTGSASPELLSAMQLTQQPYFEVSDVFSMGLGWEIHKSAKGLILTKNGLNQGFNTFITFSPQRKIGVIALFNKRNGKALPMGGYIIHNVLALNQNGK